MCWGGVGLGGGLNRGRPGGRQGQGVLIMLTFPHVSIAAFLGDAGRGGLYTLYTVVRIWRKKRFSLLAVFSNRTWCGSGGVP